MEVKMGKVISIVDMNNSETGKIVRLDGGYGIMSKLENMGIKIGSEIKKVSQQFMNGPVVISYGNTRVAVGRGMAQRIMVEVEMKK